MPFFSKQTSYKSIQIFCLHQLKFSQYVYVRPLHPINVQLKPFLLTVSATAELTARLKDVSFLLLAKQVANKGIGTFFQCRHCKDEFTVFKLRRASAARGRTGGGKGTSETTHTGPGAAAGCSATFTEESTHL